MSPLRKNKHNRSLQEMPEPAPKALPAPTPAPSLAPTPSPSHRPRTLFDRISSSLSSLLPSLSAPKPTRSTRPKTAPIPHQKRFHNRQFFQTPLFPTLPSIPSAPDLGIPILSTPSVFASHCPYDPATYHPFPTFEPHRCDFCGMRPLKRKESGAGAWEVPSEYRAGGVLSSFSSVFRWGKRESGASGSVGVGASLEVEEEEQEEGVRLVSAHVAAGRVGNPPRRARLPEGVVKGGVPRTAQGGNGTAGSGVNSEYSLRGRRDVEANDLRVESPARSHAVSKPFASRSPAPPSSGSRSQSSAQQHNASVKTQPAPKLHRTPCLPNSKAYPYVHKHEVSPHLAALRNGSPSPLRNRHVQQTRITDRYDFSETVPYDPEPIQGSSSPASRSNSRANAGRRVGSRGGSGGKDRQSVGTDVKSGRSNVHGKRGSHRHRDTNGEEEFSSDDTATTQYVGGQRLELRGGGGSEDDPIFLRLRGGSGSEERTEAKRLGFRLKRWLLTCQGPCLHGEYESEDDSPPPQLVSPGVVTKARISTYSRVALPTYISRRRDISMPPPLHLIPQTPIPVPVVHLRGGAGFPSVWQDSDTLPKTLFYLAGGRGEPISVRAWKRQRPKKRMGGLLGMAVFGSKAGKAYEYGERNAEVVASMEDGTLGEDIVGEGDGNRDENG